MRRTLWFGIGIATVLVSLIAYLNDFGGWYVGASAVSGFLLAAFYSEGRSDTGRFWLDGLLGAVIVSGLSLFAVTIIGTGIGIITTVVTGTP